MPTYVYRREDGTKFEIEQRITEDALTTCPTTGQPVTRLISGSAGLVFKGSGFYLTDYARKNGGASNGSASNGDGSTSAASDTASGDGSSKEAAPAGKDTTAASKD